MRILAFLKSLPGAVAIVQATFKGNDVETEFLMQVLDQANLGMETRPVSVALFTQLNDPRIADPFAKCRQVAEVVVGRIGRSKRNGMFFQPRNRFRIIRACRGSIRIGGLIQRVFVFFSNLTTGLSPSAILSSTYSNFPNTMMPNLA